MIIPNDLVIRATELKDMWTTRKRKFDDWYNVLLLVDELEQEGVESVVSTDPRTSYNLAKHLLSSMTIADKIPGENLPQEFVSGAAYQEKFISSRWTDQEKRYRSMGRQSWKGEVVGWMLALGWYNVFAMVDRNNVWAEVWSPYDCFPLFGPDGLVEHAHIYQLKPAAAKRKIKMMQWPIQFNRYTDDFTFYDWWGFDDDGDVCNAIVVNNQWAKLPTKHPEITKVGRLPVFCSAVGGLPDMGSLKLNQEWQKHYGEPLCATNEDLILQYNKMRSFIQHAARTGAQPHWLELSTGDTPIATEAQMETWGSIIRGMPGDSLTPIANVPIPLELTSAMYLYQNELSRGQMPNALFGILEKSMSYLSMANVAASALQILLPYRDALVGLRTDVDNFWQDMIIKNDWSPNGYKKPEVMPPSDMLKFDVSADVEIPGQLIQKATLARMLNPNFRLPQEYVIEKVFPNILNPLESMAQVRSEDAMMHPKSKMIDQIQAYETQARLLALYGDKPAADRYKKVAAALEQELLQTATQPGAEPPQETGGTAIPREMTDIGEG